MHQITILVLTIALTITSVALGCLSSTGNDLDSKTIIDSLVVNKKDRTMLAYMNRKLQREYKIALGWSPIGKKTIEGDGKTPEGRYLINSRNPKSAYHKNLGISYPNSADRKYANTLGKSPGGDIKIHGLKNGQGAIGEMHRLSDWTNGCIALTNQEIDELYKHVKYNCPIHIKP